MDKSKILVVLFFCSTILFGQNWNNFVNTGLTKGWVSHTDAFANKHGVSVVYNSNGSETQYSLLTTSGTVIKQVQLDTEGYYPIIVGDDNNLFVIYVKNNSLKVLRSTNLFNSWSNIPPPNTSNIPVTLPPSNRFQEGSSASGTN